MTNPQYHLKYHTDNKFADFLIRCITVSPDEFLFVFRKNSYTLEMIKKW